MSADDGGPGNRHAPGPCVASAIGVERRRREVLFPLKLDEINAKDTRGLDRKQVKRLCRRVREVQWSLIWMHGEGYRQIALRPESAADAQKRGKLNKLSQRQVVERVRANLGSCSAIEPSKALKSLLKGRSTYDVEGSTTVASYEYGRISLPGDVSSAPLADQYVARPTRSRKSSRSLCQANLSHPKRWLFMKSYLGKLAATPTRC